MENVEFMECIPDEDISFAVIMARYHSQWLYCKHKDRDTFEAPGGKRNNNETVEELARRELYEETGAEHFVLFHVARYCMESRNGSKMYGALFFAELTAFPKSVPEFEIERVTLYPYDKLPDKLTYPVIQKQIATKVKMWIAEREMIMHNHISTNPFETPNEILSQIENRILIPPSKQQRHEGKAFMALFLTRYCSLECKFCMYHSKARSDNTVAYYEHDKKTVQNAINFINSSGNLAYLLIAGGGEPFECYNCMLQCIQQCNVPKIVVATNAIWAERPEIAKQYICELSEAVAANPSLKEFVIRISADRWHLRRNTMAAYSEIISAVQHYGKGNIQLEFHSILDDNTIHALCAHHGWNLLDHNGKRIDTSGLEKNSPQYANIVTEHGTTYKVAYAKLFFPDLFCDLSNKEAVRSAEAVYNDDLMQSQYGNFSLVQNSDGTTGLDWLLNYNGNITTWGNYQLKQAPNINRNNADEILDKMYSDPLSYSHLHDSVAERESIVEEVDPIAVTRSKAINVRDYSAAYMLYEDKTRLYFALRQIARYRTNGLISTIPDSIERLINIDCQTLKYMYAISSYSILDQIAVEADRNPIIWKVFFRLIRSGHFAVSETEVSRVIEHVSRIIGLPCGSVDEVIEVIPGDEYQMLTSILTATPETRGDHYET